MVSFQFTVIKVLIFIKSSFIVVTLFKGRFSIFIRDRASKLLKKNKKLKLFNLIYFWDEFFYVQIKYNNYNRDFNCGVEKNYASSFQFDQTHDRMYFSCYALRQVNFEYNR